MKITLRNLSEITPYHNNPRKNAAAVKAVAASIQQFGARQPIVVDSADIIIIGHTRRLAALQLGMTTFPVHVATDLTPAQVKALRIADNKTNELAEWDLDLLRTELEELQTLDYDLDALGLDFSDVADDIIQNAELEPPPKSRFDILVVCPDEQTQARTLERLMSEGLECQSIIS